MSFALLAVVARAADEAKPYGRACVAVADVASGGETVLSATSSPGADSRLVVHLDANGPCEALVAAFTVANGQLAHGWRPALVPLAQWAEQTAPTEHEMWAWTREGEAFEVLVAFFPKAAPSAEKVRGLVERLRSAQATPAASKLLARELREEMRQWAARQTRLGTQPAAAPRGIGGTVRSSDSAFAWRRRAQRINFSAEQPGVIVFRHGGR